MAPVLTFKNGSFYLLNPSEDFFTPSSDWVMIENGYRTTSIKAAAAFRRYSDEKTASKIFDTVFQKLYDLPRLPRLSFLDDHQNEGVEWVLSRSRSYLAHAPGAGKTAQAIVAACRARGPGPCLFIVPPSLTANWQREIEKFTALMGIYADVGIVPATAKQGQMTWQAPFIICPDSMLTRPWVYNALQKLSYRILVVDEASRFKEPGAARSAALYGGKHGTVTFKGLVRRARHTAFLDGSPMPNRPMELWAPLYALVPDVINHMTQKDFGFRYCGAQQNERGEWEFNGSSREPELKNLMQKNFMHVVTEDKLSHPERRRSLLFMNQDARSPEHRAWERKYLTALSFDDISEDMSQGEMASFRQELGLRKIGWVASYVRERMKNKSEAIIVFAWHREVCLGIARALKDLNPGVIMGGVDNEDRERILEEFDQGEKDLIIGNIQALGRGHNIQRADRVIFAEFSWGDELNKQCEKRASRRGRDQSKFVRCEYVVSPSSMDEPILNSLFTKKSRVARIIG